ncbi:MAG: low temperature requirement protein A [Ilumatobacteraceae bacterium]
MTGTELDVDAPGSRHATNLELFLDLVFVFAVTQVTSFVAHDLTVSGMGKGLLLAWLAWWQWTAFTWAGTAVDLEDSATRRVMVLCMIPSALVMAITLPQALTTQSTWFAGAYWLVQVWVLAIQGVDAWKTPATRRAWAFYAPVAAVAPTLLLLGSFFAGSTLLGVWIVAGALNAVSALIGGRSRAEWSIDPKHFAERHSLFVIITLGEVLVAIGANAAARSESSGMDGPTLAAVIAAVGVACVLWWSYFAYVPRVVEHTLAHPGPRGRGHVARNLCSFGHFPIVCGVISYAVVAKHLVQHPEGHLHLPDRLILLGSVVLFVGGILNLQFQVSRSISWVRLAAIGSVAMVVAVGGLIPALAVVATVGAILGLMAMISFRRFQQTDMSRTLAGG